MTSRIITRQKFEKNNQAEEHLTLISLYTVTSGCKTWRNTVLTCREKLIILTRIDPNSLFLVRSEFIR